VRGPARIVLVARAEGEALRSGPGQGHDIDLPVAAGVPGEGHLGAVRRDVVRPSETELVVDAQDLAHFARSMAELLFVMLCLFGGGGCFPSDAPRQAVAAPSTVIASEAKQSPCGGGALLPAALLAPRLGNGPIEAKDLGVERELGV
jgi:hypothetical protein